MQQTTRMTIYSLLARNFVRPSSGSALATISAAAAAAATMWDRQPKRTCPTPSSNSGGDPLTQSPELRPLDGKAALAKRPPQRLSRPLEIPR